MAETREVATRSASPAATTDNEHALTPSDSLDIQIKTAQDHPRNLKRVKQTIRDHIDDPELAEMMWYTVPRGGKQIMGPSVRLAEVLAQAWGNLRVMTHIVETTATTVTARGVFIDLETNTGVSSDAIVQIHGRRPDDIKQAQMRAQAFARRNATFQGIPGAYARMALERAQRVYNQEPLEVRTRKMMEWFQQRGVATKTLYRALNKPVDEGFTNRDILELKGMANKIVDENKSPAQAFRQQEDSEAHAAAEESMSESQPAIDPVAAGADADMNALVISAQKKFGKKWDDVWSVATRVAGTDYDVLKSILSAAPATVGAALVDEDPDAAFLAIASAAQPEGKN